VKVARCAAEMRSTLEEDRRAGRRIALVPTMGALHEGHLSLVELAAGNADVTIASVFVNPLQFGPNEDFDEYPRDEAGDLARLESAGVHLAFLPSTEEMYPQGADVTVHAGRLGAILEGVHRPGHFDGVLTVVAKLFNLVVPDTAVFGQKDAQQLAVIRKMVVDLKFLVDVISGPTVRGPDGLALSSRNAYLSVEARSRATALWRALQQGAARLEAGASHEDAERSVARALEGEPGIDPEYAAAVDPVTFDAPHPGGPVLLLVAAYVGKTRLIDNLLVEVRGTG